MVITKTSIYSAEEFNLSNKSIHTNEIPPIIGCLISDKEGKSIVSFEIFKGAIRYFTKNNAQSHKNKRNFQLDLIPMYVSAIELLSQELNIQGLPGIEINGTNLKLKVLFTFERFTATLFLNPTVDFSLIEEVTNTYLSNLFEEFDLELNKSKQASSYEFINFLERVGLCWLLDLNDEYMRLTQN